MDKSKLDAAFADLAGRFPAYSWVYRDVPKKPGETFFKWYAPEDEQIQVAIPSGSALPERYHHQDFFFVDPERDQFSNDFLLLRPSDDGPVRGILETMVVEYANVREDTQPLLKPLALALIMYIAREYRTERPRGEAARTAEEIVAYVRDHVGEVTLSGLAEHFGYHPNYLSGMLRRETGRTFTQIETEQRMERARLLISSTTLSVEEVSQMVGYADASNFYKAFRARFDKSPSSMRPDNT